MQAYDSLPTDPLEILHSSIARIEGAYSPATIRAYFLTLLHLLPSMI